MLEEQIQGELTESCIDMHFIVLRIRDFDSWIYTIFFHALAFIFSFKARNRGV